MLRVRIVDCDPVNFENHNPEAQKNHNPDLLRWYSGLFVNKDAKVVDPGLEWREISDF